MYIRKKQMIIEDGELKWKLMPVRFDGDAIRQLVEKAERLGYETEPIADGVCGLGTFILWGPTDQYHSFLIREVYENEWTSKHTVEQFTKMPKRMEREIESLRAACGR